MAKPDDREWHALLEDPNAFATLEAYLVANSRLPGPRANLSLAQAFADEVGLLGIDDARWQLLHEWTTIGAAEAPTGDPREFLPFCALQAFGALYASAGLPSTTPSSACSTPPPKTLAGAPGKVSPWPCNGLA
jgi:hypothetical protein